MLYTTRRRFEQPWALPGLMLIALGGGLLAASQALLIVFQGDILCLNDGCEVVEKLTTVPPIAFNVAGGLYFFSLFFMFWQGARGIRGWFGMAQVLLLGGMAAEGVLVSFQHYIAQVFCSYCLIILSIIVVLNVLMGWRQLIAGVVAFSSVLVAFSCLQFTPYQGEEKAGLEQGVYGQLVAGKEGKEALHLFFSSTCQHCEEVIETLDEDFSCKLNFNPIDRLAEPPIPGMTLVPNYTPDVNLQYLKGLAISEIPVLVVSGAKEIRVLQGKQMILDYFDTYCRASSIYTETSSQLIETSSQSSMFSYGDQGAQEDGCFIEEDCEPGGIGENGPR